MRKVKMRVWDVKHGSAVYIRTPNNRHIVIDLGVGDYSEQKEDTSPVETYKNRYSISKIDLLLITHPHKDHIKDILKLDELGIKVNLFRRPKKFNIQPLIDAASENDRKLYERYKKFCDSYTSSASQEETTTVPANNDNVSFKYFDNGTEDDDNANNHSIITVVEFEDYKIVVPGDNEVESLEGLMQRTDFKNAVEDCDILIAPHHGRESAYHADFVKLCNPKLTIISDSEKCDTSANDKYRNASSGMLIYDVNQWKTRKLLTTDYDGEVYIDFGHNGAERFLNVEVKIKIEMK